MPIASELFLCKNIPLDDKYEHTIKFTSLEQQNSYFDDKVDLTISDDEYSYFRQNENIKIPFNYDSIIDINYLFYINNGKRIYCFITDKQYINDECTTLTIKEDVFQTYLFQFSLGECFIEREHKDRWIKYTNGDIKPFFDVNKENLDYGDTYISKSSLFHIVARYHDPSTFFPPTDIDFLYIFSTEKLGSSTYEKPLTEKGAPTGLYCYCLPFELATNDEYVPMYKYKTDKGVQNEIKLGNIRTLLSPTLMSDKRVFQIAISKVPFVDMEVDDVKDNEGYYVINGKSAQNANIVYTDIGGQGVLCITDRVTNPLGIEREISLQDVPYSTKFPNVDKTQNENKLRTFPYNYLRLSYGDNHIDLRKEFFGKENKIKVYFHQSLSSELTSTIRIRRYPDLDWDVYENNTLFRDTVDNLRDYVLTNQQPAILNLTTDAWRDYMLQNKNQRMAGYITTGVGSSLSAVGGFLSGGLGIFGGVASLVSGAAKIGQQVAKEKDIQNQPNDIRTNNGDYGNMYNLDRLLPVITEYRITPNYQRRIAEYFDRYGYSVNNFDYPKLEGRHYFNYVKTVDCYVKANLNQRIKNEISEIFNNGVTLWHPILKDGKPTVNIGNYANENIEENLL